MRSCELNHSKTELSKINFEDMSTSMDCENELREGDHANHAAVWHIYRSFLANEVW